MKVYSNLYKITDNADCDWEFEVLNELKDLSSRTDTNCLKHTRFLFEMDNVPIDEQKEIISKSLDSIKRVVFSGSKSLHTIIEFDEKYERECYFKYKKIWHYINHKYFNDKCDDKCTNPSRLTRRPNVLRKDKNKVQDLLYNNPNGYFDMDWDDFNSYVDSANKLNELHRKILESLNPKQIYLDTNTNTNTNGKCLNYDVIRHYLDTPYTKMCGNGDSNISLFKALATCIKYNDNETLNKVIQKAKSEKWTDKEIDKKISDIKLKQRQ